MIGKRRASLYLFLAALAGTFLAAQLNLGLRTFLTTAFLSFLLMLASKEHFLRIIFFLLMLASLSGASLKKTISTYDELLSLLPRDERTYVAFVKDIHTRPDGSKKLMLAAYNSGSMPKAQWNIVLTLHDSAAALPIFAGTNISFKAKLSPLQKALSDIHFNDYIYGLGHMIHGRGTISTASVVSLDHQPIHNVFIKLRQQLREHLLKTLTPHQASLLLALILGETSLFDGEQIELYHNIGAQHLLAVSGLQVGLIGLLCFFFMLFIFSLIPSRFCPISLPHLCAALLSIGFIWSFVALCHWPRSGVRAALMLSLILVSRSLARQVDIYDAFLSSGFFSLLYDPASIFDSGFLLSYAAVLGLIMVEDLEFPHSSWLLKKIAKLLIGSWAAFLATLPIVLYLHQSFAPAGMLANFILVPIASLLQIPAILGGFFAAVLHFDGLSHVAVFFASCIEILVGAIEEILGFVWHLPYLSPLMLAIAALGFLMIFMTIFNAQKLPTWPGIVLLAIPACALFAHQSDELHVSVLAVGQGDSSIFSLPSGHHLLIDAGGQPYGQFDPGKAIVLKSLRRKGINALDVLIISHPDPDHILGAFSAIEQMPIKEIWHSGFHERHPLTNRLIDLAKAKGIPIKNARELLGAHHFGQTVVEVLAPESDGDVPYYEKLSANDNSLVIKISYQGQSLLWPGDLEAKGEKLLLKSGLNIKAKVLKAPHHGSRTSSTLPFVQSVAPDFVIFSTGRNNRFSFPHKEVLKRYEAQQIEGFDTAGHGEVNIRLGKRGTTINTYTKP